LRREEVGGLYWSEVDLDQGVIRLPAERCKNKRPHDQPLSPPAVAILEALLRTGDKVFAAFGSWGRAKERLDRKLTDTVAPWVLHDFRRLISTTMHAKLGIAPHVVESVLGHVGHQGGVAGTYNRAEYATERRRALEKWAAHVEEVVSGKQSARVVQLRK
jgi:integrase